MRIGKDDLLNIVSNTLNMVDDRLVGHGMRVAYLLHCMVTLDGTFSEQQVAELVIAGVLHDVGAYKTDEIDNMLLFENMSLFENAGVWSHAIYGYLFIEKFTPIKSLAKAILFHHSGYVQIKTLDALTSKAAAMIHLADRVDAYHTVSQKSITRDFLNRYRGIEFDPEIVDLFLQVEEKFDMQKNLNNGGYVDYLRHLDIEIAEEQVRQYLLMLMYFIDFRSEITVRHSVSTVSFSKSIGQLMGLNAVQMEKIEYGAMLHDLGKIAIPVEILEKEGSLSAAEMDVMKKHVDYTNRILKDHIDPEVCNIAIRHHEKLDGSGYMFGLKGEELTLPERIVAVADIVSALSNRRSYKEEFNKEKTLHILKEMRDQNKICPCVVSTVLEHYDEINVQACERSDETVAAYNDINCRYNELYAQYAENKQS